MYTISLFFLVLSIAQCENLRGPDGSDLDHRPGHHHKDPLCKISWETIQDWCDQKTTTTSQPSVTSTTTSQSTPERGSNDCWYAFSVERTKPKAQIGGHEIGRDMYPIHPMQLSVPPVATSDGYAMGISLHGNKIVPGNQINEDGIIDAWAYGLWIQPETEFNDTFAERLAQIDYSEKDVQTFNTEILGNMTSGCGMHVSNDGEDVNGHNTYPDGDAYPDGANRGKIFRILFKLQQADPDQSWNSTQKIPAADVPLDGQGLYRPCAQSYDMNQTHCKIAREYDTTWPVGENQAWENEWFNRAWGPESDDPYPFTGQGWTFDVFGYRDFYNGGCKASPEEYRKMVFGISEMVVAHGTTAKYAEDPLTPMEYACKYCDSQESDLHCPQNFKDFSVGKCP